VDLTAEGRVQRLPDDVANQIAAGEVVERPASVVKELVENALDADARAVRVEIAGGGKSWIRVHDDGTGMSREDARLALERHATSKLRTLDDLQSLRTHGFRGEALPAIASVSHLVLLTREEGSAAGTEVEAHDGRLIHVRDAGHPRGTTVEVRDLFGGVPARRKFLRADSTETAHSAEAVTLLALARPSVRFTLMSSGRPLIEASPVPDLADRVYQLFGRELLEGLLAVEGGGAAARVRGFVGRPDRRASGRASLRLFVNGRAVRDRALARAVTEAYRRTGASELRGHVLLFLDVPPHLVDVNVHPAKAEVRFADARGVWSALEDAVVAALSRGGRSAPAAEVRGGGPPASADGWGPSERQWHVAESAAPWVGEPPAAPAPLPVVAPPPPELLSGGPLSVLGQHRLTYVVATDGDDLLLFDQHTAHERVRFEALLERMERRAPESQLLIEPMVVTIPPAQRALLEDGDPPLAALGYDLEPFGGGSWRLRAVPAILGPADPVASLHGVLRDLLERAEDEWAVEGPWSRLAATVACHSAVRAGQALTREAMAAIVAGLPRTAHPTLCPHGRPTVVRLPQPEVSRWFARTGWKRR
jgi:DNA mismatch repair protein MutL